MDLYPQLIFIVFKLYQNEEAVLKRKKLNKYYKIIYVKPISKRFKKKYIILLKILKKCLGHVLIMLKCWLLIQHNYLSNLSRLCFENI